MALVFGCFVTEQDACFLLADSFVNGEGIADERL